MTGSQIDIEDAIEASGGKQSFKSLREDRREKLITMAREVERYLQEAKDKNSPLAKELSVRAGKRTVDDLFRKVRALATVADPNPHFTHPTNERVSQAGEVPDVSVAYDGVVATGVKHRWLWAVEVMRREGSLELHELLAADRFRRSYYDSLRSMKSPALDDDSRARGDPARRDGLSAANHTRQQKGLALAGGEVNFVWKHLTELEKRAAYSLVLEETYTDQQQPYNLTEFGRRLPGAPANDQSKRERAKGILFATLTRMSVCYLHLDRQQAPKPDQAETDKRLWEVPQRRIASRVASTP